MNPNDLIDAWLTTSVSAVLLFCWTDNLIRSSGLWRSYRDSRSFRAFLIAILLFTGSLTFFVGAIGVYLYPPMLDAARSLGLVIRGLFLVVGIFSFITWRRR